MLNVPQNLLDEIYAHGEEAWPGECCGLLIGTNTDGVRTVTTMHKAVNHAAAERNDRYEIGPADRQTAETMAKERGEAVIGFYHSHPDHDSYFSRTDLRCSEEYMWGEPWIPPTYAYFVISIHGKQRDHYKTFIVENGQAVEQAVTVTD